MNPRAHAVLAHTGIPGPGPFIATGLFFAGFGAAFGAYTLYRRRGHGFHRSMGIVLGVVSFGCFGVATVFPLLLHASPSLTRPSTTARLAFVSPTEGQVIRGNPAPVSVILRLEGGKVVPFSSLHLIPNVGHIHLYLDGSLVSMTYGLGARIRVTPGRHVLRAEFVAVDHGPFQPRVVATANFRVVSGDGT